MSDGGRQERRARDTYCLPNWHDPGPLPSTTTTSLLPVSSFPFLLSFSSHLLPPLSFVLRAMAIEKVPGQKGVNWSNIAVGKCSTLVPLAYASAPRHIIGSRYTELFAYHRWHHEHGTVSH